MFFWKMKKSRYRESVSADNEPEQFFRDLQVEFLIHELKDPVSIIETGLRTLLTKQDKYGELTGSQLTIVRRVLRNTIKTRDMLNGLMEVGRSEAACFLPCRFQPVRTVFAVLMDAMETTGGTILDEVNREGLEEAELLRHLAKKGIRFYISPETVETEMNQDETKFRQIVGNLIKNALHHRRQSIEIKMSQKGSNLCIDVSDDGTGIDDEHHEMVFRRYTQVADCATVPRKGHGLGLAGARIMARCMGGDIKIISQKPAGATFRLCLPLDLNKAVATEGSS